MARPRFSFVADSTWSRIRSSSRPSSPSTSPLTVTRTRRVAGSSVSGVRTRRRSTRSMPSDPLTVAAAASSIRSLVTPSTSPATAPMAFSETESSPRLGSTRSM